MDQLVKTTQGKTNFDSEFCGSIPLNFINLIQPHGVLIVADKVDLRVVQVSDSCKDLLKLEVSEILDKSLSEFIGNDEYEDIVRKLANTSIVDQIPITLSFKVGEGLVQMSCGLHCKENYLILELEFKHPIEGNISFTDLHQHIKYIVAKLKEERNIEKSSQEIVKEVRRLSGFDRVMIYEFDEHWNGTVIAEEMADGMEPYLHLHFPASDIPKQARDLYLKNPYRLIPNRSARPSRLLPVLNPLTNSFTDLSDCNLRSVPSVHSEYLRNMNVMASMSTPIVKEGKLWGLISCHHKSEKHISYEMASCFELVANILSSQLFVSESEERLRLKAELIEINGRLLERLIDERDVEKGLFGRSPSILQLLKINGASLAFENGISSLGETPERKDVIELILWLQRRNNDDIFYSDNLSEVYPEAKTMNKVASGLIAIPINTIKGHYILGYRPETIRNVNWGGNPYNPINVEADGKTYHPRNSFNQWKEIVKNTSSPWMDYELEAAGVLRTNVLQSIIRLKTEV